MKLAPSKISLVNVDGSHQTDIKNNKGRHAHETGEWFDLLSCLPAAGTQDKQSPLPATVGHTGKLIYAR